MKLNKIQHKFIGLFVLMLTSPVWAAPEDSVQRVTKLIALIKLLLFAMMGAGGLLLIFIGLFKGAKKFLNPQGHEGLSVMQAFGVIIFGIILVAASSFIMEGSDLLGLTVNQTNNSNF